MGTDQMIDPKQFEEPQELPWTLDAVPLTGEHVVDLFGQWLRQADPISGPPVEELLRLAQYYTWCAGQVGNGGQGVALFAKKPAGLSAPASVLIAIGGVRRMAYHSGETFGFACPSLLPFRGLGITTFAESVLLRHHMRGLARITMVYPKHGPVKGMTWNTEALGFRLVGEVRHYDTLGRDYYLLERVMTPAQARERALQIDPAGPAGFLGIGG